MAVNCIAEYQMVQILEKMQVPVNELKKGWRFFYCIVNSIAPDVVTLVPLEMQISTTNYESLCQHGIAVMPKAGVGYNPQYVVIYPISTLVAVAL